MLDNLGGVIAVDSPKDEDLCDKESGEKNTSPKTN